MASSAYDLADLDLTLRESLFAGKVEFVPETESTNALGMQAAADGAPEGTVFLADQQTAGRGRNGHAWHSEAGTAILASIILRPQIAPSQALWLSLMAGVAVHDAILRTCGICCDLRWPNDLLINRRKVCGILTEIAADAEHLRFAVIGIGINVNQTKFAADISKLATSVQIETGKAWPRTELLGGLLSSLQREYRAALAPEGTTALLRKVESISTFVRSKRVHVDEAGGYEGVTDGLDERGFLRVRTQSGIKTVISGGVREARPGGTGQERV